MRGITGRGTGRCVLRGRMYERLVSSIFVLPWDSQFTDVVAGDFVKQRMPCLIASSLLCCL